LATVCPAAPAAAELEEGLRDSADHSAHTTVVLPSSWKLLNFQDRWSGDTKEVHHGTLQLDLQHAQSVLLVGGR
jgi:hypothetical protein